MITEGLIWTTRAGQKIAVAEMTDSHLRNTIWMLDRQITACREQASSAASASSHLTGEMALDAAESAMDEWFARANAYGEIRDAMSNELQSRRARRPGSPAMTRTPAEIAAGLTKAQREAFLAADVNDLRCPHCSTIYWDFPECMSAYPAHWNPDCLPEDDGGTEWTWEPLGLAVRAIIEQDRTDAE